MLSPSRFLDTIAVLSVCAATFSLVGCGSDRPPQQAEGPAPKQQAVSAYAIESLAISPERPSRQTDLKAVVRYSGPPGQLAYQWHRNGSPIEGSSEAALPASRFEKGDEIRVRASLGGGREGGASLVSAPVRISNSLPRVMMVWITPQQPTKEGELEAHAQAVDADNDSVSFRYKWMRSGEEIPGANGSKLVLKEMSRGNKISVSATPFDGEEEGPHVVSSPVEILNASPTITSRPPEKVVGTAYSYQVVAVDVDGDPLSYRLVKAPAGMRVDEKGLVTWAFSDKEAGVHPIEVQVVDSEGAKAFQTFTVTVAVTAQKPKP